MPLSDRLTPIVLNTVDLLRQPANLASLGIREQGDVFYGDQMLIPRTPAVCVEAGPLNRELSGIGGKGRTTNTITVFLLCYIARIQDMQLTRREADEFAEKIMDILHQDVTRSGLVVHGFVTGIEPGYATRGDTNMRAARITWTGMTKTGIV